VAAETAVVVGTSGSTGAPKGVELSAAALLQSARASLDRIGASPGERWLLCLPASHIAGLQVLVRSLLSGTDPVVAGQADGTTLADAVSPAGARPSDRASACSEPVSHVSLVPTQLQRLGAGMPVLNAFKSVLVGGAAAAPGLIRQAREAGARVITTYGMTETCGGCVYDGEPLAGVRIRVDADDRIAIAGPVLFEGYYGQRRDRDGWFRTSDLGQIDEDGRLTVLGRADDVIVTGGHKVVPAEVAAALQTAPGVREAAVLGQSDSEWGERVVAVVVPSDPDDPPTLKMLCMHVKESLPRYASPSRVVLVAAIPLLPSGKPDLMRLRRDLK
jgi:O-succinylbenzoic acid--CoA ligase